MESEMVKKKERMLLLTSGKLGAFTVEDREKRTRVFPPVKKSVRYMRILAGSVKTQRTQSTNLALDDTAGMVTVSSIVPTRFTNHFSTGEFVPVA